MSTPVGGWASKVRWQIKLESTAAAPNEARNLFKIEATQLEQKDSAHHQAALLGLG